MSRAKRAATVKFRAYESEKTTRKDKKFYGTPFSFS